MFGDYSKESVFSVFIEKMESNPETLREELRKLGPSKLKAVCESVGASLGDDKISTINNIVGKMTQGEETMGKKKKEVKKVAKAVKAPEAPVEVPEIEAPTEAPEVVPGLSTESVELKIDKEWLKAVPRMSAADEARTAASIKESGLQKPIEVVQREDGLYIYDGHSRHKIMTELGLPITKDDIKIIEAPTDPLYGIYVANIARRQLSDIDKIKLARKYYPQIMAKVKEEQEKEAEKRKKEKAEKKKAIVEAKKTEKMPDFLRTSTPPAEQKGGKKKAKEEKEKTHTREAIAKVTGVSPAKIKLDQWLNKYAKKFYDESIVEAKKLGQEPEIGTIYARAQEMWKTVKKHDPEALEKIKNGELELAAVAEDLWEKIPAEPRKAGPVEKAHVEDKDAFWKVLEKKYGGSPTPDEYEADYIARLDIAIQDAATKGK